MRLSSIVLFSILSQVLFGQGIKLSTDAEVRLVTCGPGQNELYSAFGHSAFRVIDPEIGINIIYNYGVFDFDQPNFYLNFTRGHLNYMLAKNDYNQFRDYYIRHNRSISEQILNLNLPQKQKIFDFLEWNSLPENRFYLYDYFYDNCATRIIDALSKALEEDISFSYSTDKQEKTIRQLTDDYLELQPWGDLGIDICLGLPMDKIATPRIQLFLPDYVKSNLDNATINKVGKIEPLVDRTIDIYTEKEMEVPEAFFSPQQVFWGLLILIALFSAINILKGKWRKWIDFAFFTTLGLLGIFLLLLWLATDHDAASNNLNILWALPLHIFGIILLIRRSRMTSSYFKYSTFWYLILAIAWFFLPQQMHPVLFPIVLIMIIRSFVCWRNTIKYGTPV